MFTMSQRAAMPADLIVTVSRVQDVFDTTHSRDALVGEGWAGFRDGGFAVQAVLVLLLAAGLGAILAYLPRRYHTVDSLKASEAPKVFVLYAVIGAVIGMMVLRFGLVVGFVVFGIGGLTRFRTELPAPDTGRLILITLIGLACGLNLPHLAVLVAAFGLVLYSLLDRRVTYQMAVKGTASDALPPAARAYRDALEHGGYRVLNERKDFGKQQVTFVFRAPYASHRDRRRPQLDSEIPQNLRGAVDWEIG